jgi:hypothetical protein
VRVHITLKSKAHLNGEINEEKSLTTASRPTPGSWPRRYAARFLAGAAYAERSAKKKRR